MTSETKITILFFFVFGLFCAPMISNARILSESGNTDSLTLFRKLGFELPNRDQMFAVGSKRKVPAGPNDDHNLAFYKYLRGAPAGPDPHHHSTSMDFDISKFHDGLFRDAPWGPDHYHNWASMDIDVSKFHEGLLKDAPNGPDPHHNSVPTYSDGLLREAPSGPNPNPHLVAPPLPIYH
ncbi:hypothetical protein M9H77_21137 [Catharanthus roseus]|uniref:Uncharacterized protein n=1 Tax=Catharanthus roseus TaxID=4058 RepID=A0ACC0ANS2_CATRO|nr:hypothetical protein M9H77_21137 [Catharanthus roseus]